MRVEKFRADWRNNVPNDLHDHVHHDAKEAPQMIATHDHGVAQVQTLTGVESLDHVRLANRSPC